MSAPRLNVLFVCSFGQWRSPTAEKLYSRDPRFNTRSGGTSSKARRSISQADIRWADVIIAMEPKHRQRLQADHPEATRYKAVHVLEIEDNYQFMDGNLVDELQAAIDPILEESLQGRS